MAWVLLKTLGSLAAVLGLMFALIVFMKKYVYGSQAAQSTLIAIDVLGQRVLQPKRSVAVIRVLNRVFILGVAEEGITKLGEIDNEEILRWIDASNADAALGQGKKKAVSLRAAESFSELLSQNLGFVRPRNGRKSKGFSSPDIEP